MGGEGTPFWVSRDPARSFAPFGAVLPYPRVSFLPGSLAVPRRPPTGRHTSLLMSRLMCFNVRVTLVSPGLFLSKTP
jgi:hypothetical protein